LAPPARRAGSGVTDGSERQSQRLRRASVTGQYASSSISEFRDRTETAMARKTILVSDLTGKEIEEKNAAKITINFSDARKGTIVIDANETEISDLVSTGTRQARRGRKPKN
jgi:hypothetical protein